MLDFGQVKIDSRIMHDPVPCIVEEVESKIEQAGGCGLAVHQNVFLRQMPPARPHEQRRYRFIEPVALAFRTGVFDGAANGIAHIDLTIERARPCW